MKKQRILIFSITIVITFLLTIQIASLIPFLAENLKSLTFALVKNKSLDILIHPIHTVNTLIDTQNPIFYFLFIAAFFYSIFLAYRLGDTKEGWEVDKKEQSHGSARFGKPKEIFHKGEFNGCNRQDAFEELLLLMEEGESQHGRNENERHYSR